ncbi:hypothetical protein N9Z65_00765 [bacterium]|nr:hypothetical protein [bacterium]
MKENKEICYPYAHGRLDSSLQHLTINLEAECLKSDIAVNKEVFKMLEDMIQDQRKTAIIESYEHS